MSEAISYKDVKKAAERLRGKTYPTPLMRCDAIDQMTGLNVWFKPECTQKVGAFKYRGAYNRLSAMSDDERARGVVAFSSGNHAQGVARAAKELGMSAIIVMPEDAPKIKIDGVLRDGAEIVFYDRHSQNREKISDEIASRDNRIVVPSFDDPYIIAGQGTTGLEIGFEAKELGIQLDAVITPMGGGGLCAGTGIAIEALCPDTQMYGAEPAGYNDHQLSIRAGRRIAYENPPLTLCDAIMTPIPGELTFPINNRLVDDVFTVTDQECLHAMAVIKTELGIPVEPGGVVGFAAVLNEAFRDTSHRIICVVLSGGNVDPDIMARAEAIGRF
ncbi:MAG: threonine/serine dehydratase [Hellea sp.]|nr:threonine/serine dehydratase [Hellea sp.]